MAPHRARSPSPVSAQLFKKAKHAPNLTPDVSALSFAPDLFDPLNTSRLRAEYVHSEPFKHCVVETLVHDALLRKVKDECAEKLSFTEKETDIYKVWSSSSPVVIPDDLTRLLFRFNKRAT